VGLLTHASRTRTGGEIPPHAAQKELPTRMRGRGVNDQHEIDDQHDRVTMPGARPTAAR
jgi:hypothetical protein